MPEGGAGAPPLGSDGYEWPVPPDVVDPRPAEPRRSWGKLPHEERYRRQRRDLLRAAARLASRSGYQGTRVSDIVSEAGLSKGTFYEHFESKEECFVELYRRANAGMIRAGISSAEQSFVRGAYPTILAVVRALVDYVYRDPRLAEVMRVELGAAHPAIGSERQENQRKIAEIFVVIARRLGTPLDERELRLASNILVQGVTALMPELRARGGGLDETLEAIARVGCRGLGLASA